MSGVNWAAAVLGAVALFVLVYLVVAGARPGAGAHRRPPLHVRLAAPGTCLWQDAQGAQQLQQCGGVCDGATDGQTCVASCPQGLQFAGALEGQREITFTCVAGTWSSFTTAPACVPPEAECPPLFPNQTVGFRAGSVCIGARNGDVCTLACGAGMFPSGATSAVCQNGTWSSALCCGCGSMVDEVACNPGCTPGARFCIQPNGSFSTQ